MTPLEISVAIHYWCFTVPYKNGSENWNELEAKIVTDMIVGHLLEHQDGKLSGNTPAMRCFMEALQAVPWPSIKWVCEPSPVSFPAMDGSCFICGGKHGGLQCPRAVPCSGQTVSREQT